MIELFKEFYPWTPEMLKENITNRLFFGWHHFLTGSCQEGRMRFVESKGIDLDSEMTTIDFLNLTKNEYNGNAIAEILNRY